MQEQTITDRARIAVVALPALVATTIAIPLVLTPFTLLTGQTDSALEKAMGIVGVTVWVAFLATVAALV